MKNSYLLLVVFTCALLPASAGSKVNAQKNLTIVLRDKSVWQQDDSFAPQSVFTRNYYFAGSNDDIDLSVIAKNLDLLKEVETKGFEAVVNEIVEGQNIARRMFDRDEIKIDDKGLSSRDGMKVITLKSREKISGSTYSRIEEFYLIPGSYMQVSLRWNDSLDEALKEKARKEFMAKTVAIGSAR